MNTRKKSKTGFTPLEIKRENKFLTGFTLIEMMAGIALFSFALFPMLMLLSQSLTFGTFANNRTIAMNEARRVVEDIRRVADTNGLASLVGMTWTGTSLPNATISVTDFSDNALQNNANPLSVRVAINWTDKGKAAAYRVDTLVTPR